MIRLHDVSVAVPTNGGGDKTLLAHISLELAEHRIAFVGANGSGKSTLLRLLNGLILPTVGSVEVEGLDTRRDGKAVRQKVGFVFSDALAQLVMVTPVEDIELSLRRVEKDRGRRHARALELLAAQGLERVARQSVYDLSGGERQLVALTSVLATDPVVVVADEPTTLLDLRNRNIVTARLAAVAQQLVYATHDLAFAAQAERVLCVDGGRIVADGAPGEVIAFYERLVQP